MASEQTAAILAAALIQCGGKDIGKVQQSPAEAAAEIYFQCLDALNKVEKKRSKVSCQPLNL